MKTLAEDFDISQGASTQALLLASIKDLKDFAQIFAEEEGVADEPDDMCYTNFSLARIIQHRVQHIFELQVKSIAEMALLQEECRKYKKVITDPKIAALT